jgi:EAL domain-containing protein (putative c-di-GMP-specific phosphodiesterase class I)/GGDEF domain-containing protein
MQARVNNLVSVARLEQIISTRAVRFVFQPIADVPRKSFHGFEALMRGPAGSELESPERLLEVARYAGLGLELELLACVEAVKAFAERHLAGCLFLNVSARTLESLAEQSGGRLLEVARARAISPERIILELTEHERVSDLEGFCDAVGVLRGLGFKLAIDDFGDGRSSLRLWTQLDPEIVKIDRFFVQDVHRDHRKLEVLRTVIRLAETLDTPVVVEGIECDSELAIVRELGCRFAQGYLIARPAEHPPKALDDAVCQVLEDRQVVQLATPVHRPDPLVTVEGLAQRLPTVRSGDTCEVVLELFKQHAGMHAIAVLEDGFPVGLINRQTFVDKMAQRFHIDLFGRRPCALFMDANPLRVDRFSTIDSLANVMMGDDQRYLVDGFIVTDKGLYFGLGTGERLVRAVTERRIEAARLANPLTCLPGNVPITDHIRRLLRAQAPFRAAYFDLNNFKPYNDLYGYWRGDEMIKLASAVLVRHCDSRCDFVGHVGGDDFVVLFQSADWELRCRRVLEEFSLRARGLFDAAELARGGFVSEDRHGFERMFPLTSICVGVVSVLPGCCADPEAVASSAALAKKAAKRNPDHFYATDAITCSDSDRFDEHAAVA